MGIKEALLGLTMLMYTGCGITNCGNPTKESEYESSVPQVAMADFESRILQADGQVIVDFYADWCPACGDFEAPYDKTASAMSDEATFFRYDMDPTVTTQQEVDQFNGIRARYQIYLLPTVIVFREGITICRPEPVNVEQFQRNIEACLE